MQGKMKIVFVCSRYQPYAVGGAEETVRLLAEGLVRDGGEAVVVSLAPGGKAEERVIQGVHVYYVPLFNVFTPHDGKSRPAWLRAIWQAVEAWNPVMARRLIRIVERESPDLVHIHNILGFSCAVWPALARRGRPILQTLHDYYAACCNSLMYNNGKICAERCLRCRVFCRPRVRLSRHVDGLTSVSLRLWERIKPAGPFAGSRNARVIYNCNDEQAIVQPRTGPKPGVPLRVGFLGRIEPVKGLHILLEAAERIGSDHVQVQVGGAGTQAYAEGLRNRFKFPLANFLGHVTPVDYFKDVDILVMPSLMEEPAGRVLHEAYSFGVPVIGMRLGGMPELVRDGVTGYLAPAPDVEGLEAILRHLLDSPPDWLELSRNCLEEAGRFKFDVIFAKYRDAWHDVLNRHGTTAKRTQYEMANAS
jgi:glycosyltransferase involved in cell wall biosynthesis